MKEDLTSNEIGENQIENKVEYFPTKPNFKIIEHLGQGTFGSAFKVLNEEDNGTYVIKKIFLKSATEEEIKDIQNEANILSSLNSENIVKYYDSFIDKDSFNIVMEYCEGLDLRKYINQHKELNIFIEKDIIIYIFLGICNGLKEIHDKNIIHRDLKPENIFLDSEMKVKIGDFGVAKKLKNENDYAKTQTGTLLYMAPEILDGGKYNAKVDIWALGCILHELCTLNFSFAGDSISEIMEKIKGVKCGKINPIYDKVLQDIIDKLLEYNSKNRPNINEIKKYFKIRKSFEQVVNLFQNDEVYQNYLLEKNILNSMYQIQEIIIKDLCKVHQIKHIWNLIFLNSTSYFSFGFLNFIIQLLYFDNHECEQLKVNVDFLRVNSIIMKIIQKNLMKNIEGLLDEKVIKEKIVIYDGKNFENKIKTIKDKLLENYFIKKLQKILTKNFNVLLLGNTNVGKSTLINEFLKLDNSKKAKESEGGPTNTEDFTQYKGKNNNKTYILYDTNGITNSGENSIEFKKENIKNEIAKRLKSHDPNQLIHCIWYCFQGSNIQPSDKDFIENLLKIYTTYSIPIIYIHTQSAIKSQSETCKKAIDKYMMEIYNNDKSKVEQQLSNYINIIARDYEEEKIKAFGLDELEKLTYKEIKEKGIKSSFSEYIKQIIKKILINGVFNLILTEYSIKNLVDYSKKNLDKFSELLLTIINNDKLGLTQEIKNKNINSLKNLCERFKNILPTLKDDLKDLLEIKKLKTDYRDLVRNIYEKKNI